MDSSDWRAQLQPQLREGLVKEIMHAVKLWHDFNEEDELELEKVAQSFERKTYAGATSLSDYYQIIQSKMVSMERQTKEEIYQKIQVLKERHLEEMNEIHKRLSKHIQQSHDFLRLEKFKAYSERVIEFLQVSKSKISPSSKKKLASSEEFIMRCKKAQRVAQSS